jgi:hypothetical protein
MDEIVRRLARKDAFPNLTAIVLAGHSGGGMFVARYQMANRIHETLGLPVTYVSANPTNHAYLDALRPTVSAVPVSMAAGAPGYTAALPANPAPPFVPFGDAKYCSGYDNWPYGLRSRTGYSAQFSDDQLRRHLAARPLTYVLGNLDILPIAGFDSSCPAMAEGATRFWRAVAFIRHVNERFGAKHGMVVVANCGHHEQCVLTSTAALKLLFPN